jgi:hypothetical protein
MNSNLSRASRSRFKLQAKLAPLFWGGSLVAGGLLLAILYCLLTRQIPG